MCSGPCGMASYHGCRKGAGYLSTDGGVYHAGRAEHSKRLPPPTSPEEWLAAVEKQLKGKPFEKALVKTTYEGIAVQPMYFRHDLKGRTASYDQWAQQVRAETGLSPEELDWSTN